MDGQHPMSPNRRQTGETSGRAKIAALLAVALLAGALLWAAQAIVHHNAMQNCLDSGRRDCAAPGGP